MLKDIMITRVEEIEKAIDNTYDWYIDINHTTSKSDIREALTDVFNAIVSHACYYPEDILDRLVKYGITMAEDADTCDAIYGAMLKHGIDFKYPNVK